MKLLLKLFLSGSLLVALSSCQSKVLTTPIVTGTETEALAKDLHFLNEDVGFCTYLLGSNTVVVSRTEDGGKSWKQVAKSEEFEKAGSFTLSSVGFWNENDGMVTGQGGTLLTSDGGDTWTYTKPWKERRDSYTWNVYSSKNGAGCLMLDEGRYGTALQFHKTGKKPGSGPLVEQTDGGVKPTFVNNGEFVWLDDGTLAAWSQGEVYFTTDEGESWTALPLKNIGPDKTDGDEIEGLALLPGPEFRYFVRSAKSRALKYRISKSGEFPGDFERKTVEFQFEGEEPNFVKELHFFDDKMGIALTESESSSIYQTQDGGKTWKLLLKLPGEYIHPVLEVLNKDRAFVAFKTNFASLSLTGFDPTP